MFRAIYNIFHGHYHRHYHGKYTHAKKLFAFDLVLLTGALVTLAAGLFFFFWTPGLTDWIDLSVSYGDGRIKSGEKVIMTLDYVNRSKESLTNVTLAIHLPPGFIIDRTLTPTTEFSEQSIFNLPTLLPGAKGKKIIHGTLWTEPKKETETIAILSYTPENINRREQKFGRFLINLPESVLKTELNLNIKSSFPYNRFPFALTLTNTEAQKVEDVSLNCSWPGKIEWKNQIEKLTLDGKETRVFNGEIVMPNTAGLYTLKIQPQISVNNQLVVLDTIINDISVVYPRVTTNVNWETTATYAEPNVTLPIKISWKNNSQYELKNLQIKINTTPGVVNLKKTAQQNNLKIIGDSLILDASNRTLLSDGTPQSTGDTKIDLVLLSSFALNEKEKAYLEVTPILEAELKEITEKQIFTNTGSSIKILLATNATLRVEARYFTSEGDQLGRGPLPPRVGETTKYWIFAQLQNTTNRLKDISFEANLTPGVEFTGKQSVTVGSPLKNQNGKLVWGIFQLPANSATGWYFEIAVTPNNEQIGRNLNLVKNINVLATDEETGKKFDLNSGGITNILPANDAGKTQGGVVQK